MLLCTCILVYIDRTVIEEKNTGLERVTKLCEHKSVKDEAVHACRHTHRATHSGCIAGPHGRLSLHATSSPQRRGDGLSKDLLATPQKAVLPGVLAALDGGRQVLLAAVQGRRLLDTETDRQTDRETKRVS